MDKQILQNGAKFINFLNKSPTAFHVVESSKQLLKEAGFSELKISEPWKTAPMGKYFVTKNESTLIAFSVGGKYVHGNGFAVVGAHTDSPCLKMKLASKRTKQGYLECGVECYGGGIWATWFDRDLTVAGRVLVNQNGKISHRLVHLNKPILRIPNLAIHLDRTMNEKFSPNKETHLTPILATVVQEKLLNPQPKSESTDESKVKTQAEKHQPLLINLICNELSCKPEEIVDLELQLCDTQPAVLGGVYEEFIFGGRLDNQVGAYCSIKAIIESAENITDETGISIAAIYDHEEVGSDSAVGAGSSVTEHILRRLSSPDTFELAMARSFLMSADQAHAVHPNYSEKHEEEHRPSMHGGIVLKHNSNQRYASNSISASVLRESSKLADVPVQDFMVRNDCPCGSTIGPIMSAKLGLTTVDVGMPQLSMHSIRETGSTVSITQYIKVLASFFKNYTKIRQSFSEFM